MSIEDALIHCGDAVEVLRTLPDASVNCCVTSPPYYGLRDYGVSGQIGLEPSPDEYVSRLVDVFREVRRVLRDDGTVWLNLGDSYGGASANSGGKNRNDGGPAVRVTGLPAKSGKPKDLLGIPWRVAFALQADGWYLRSDIIWHKPNPMPESVKDRPTKGHEYVFLLSKRTAYYYDSEAISEPQTSSGYGGFSNKATLKTVRHDQKHKPSLVNATNDGRRNRRSVWTLPTKPCRDAHFAVMPDDLAKPCILAGCPVGGTVLDPFAGAGTTGKVALANGRKFVGIELNPEYIEIANRRIRSAVPELQVS